MAVRVFGPISDHFEKTILTFSEVGLRPRLCENPNSETSSGKSKLIHGLSLKHVEFMGLIKRYAKSITGCYPNISEG